METIVWEGLCSRSLLLLNNNDMIFTYCLVLVLSCPRVWTGDRTGEEGVLYLPLRRLQISFPSFDFTAASSRCASVSPSTTTYLPQSHLFQLPSSNLSILSDRFFHMDWQLLVCGLSGHWVIGSDNGYWVFNRRRGICYQVPLEVRIVWAFDD